MKAIGRLFSWLFVSRQSTDADDHPDLVPLVFEDLRKELDVDIEARKLGQTAERRMPRLCRTSVPLWRMRPRIIRSSCVRSNLSLT